MESVGPSKSHEAVACVARFPFTTASGDGPDGSGTKYWWPLHWTPVEFQAQLGLTTHNAFDQFRQTEQEFARYLSEKFEDNPYRFVERGAKNAVEAGTLYTNPTIKGRTWMVWWDYSVAVIDPRWLGKNNSMLILLPRTEVAFVVAPPGMILQQGSRVLIANAWDLNKEECHQLRQAVLISCDPLLLDESLRIKLGGMMHWNRNVYFVTSSTKEGKSTKPRSRKTL